jgi:hypothetical protein
MKFITGEVFIRVLPLILLYISTVLKQTGLESVDQIHLAQDKVQWCTLVNTVLNEF